MVISIILLAFPKYSVTFVSVFLSMMVEAEKMLEVIKK